MIKVFQVIPSLEMGGAEKFVLDLSSNIDRNRFEVSIISLYECSDSMFYKEAIEKQINVIFLNKKKGFDMGTILRFNKLLKEHKPDVVHTHTIVDRYTIIPCIINRIKRKIHTVHSVADKEIGSSFARKIMYFAYHFCKVVPVGVSSTVTASVKKEYKLKDVLTIYNGIDTERYSKKTGRDRTENYVFINVARMSSVKNQILLLKAFKLAYQKNKKIKLLLVGDGPMRSELEEFINKDGLHGVVKMVGRCNDVENQLKKADCFVLTSKYEGLPMSVLEAMSCGLPIVSTNVGGISDVVVDNHNGFLCSGDERMISSKMLEIAGSKEKQKAFSKNSLNMSKKYDLKKMVKEYERLYENHK